MAEVVDEVVDEVVGSAKDFTKENKDFKIEEFSLLWGFAMWDNDDGDDAVEVEKVGRVNEEGDFLGIESSFCPSIFLSSTSTVGAWFLLPVSLNSFIPTLRQPTLRERER